MKKLEGGVAMKNVVVYEVQTNNPAVLGLRTNVIVSAGATLCYRQRNTYGNVYYIGDGILAITEIPACCRDVRYFVVRNGERTFLVESLGIPTLLSEGEEFLSYLRSLIEEMELWITYGLWYFARFVFTDPNERKEFEKLMTKEPYSKHYIWYYYSAYIDKDAFLELVDKVKGKTNCK